MKPGGINDGNKHLSKESITKYKGAFFYQKGAANYQDAKTGAHFDYTDMCTKLSKLRRERSDSEMSDVSDNDIAEERPKPDPLNLYTNYKPKKLISSLVSRSKVIHTWAKERSANVLCSDKKGLCEDKARKEETICSVHTINSSSFVHSSSLASHTKCIKGGTWLPPEQFSPEQITKSSSNAHDCKSAVSYAYISEAINYPKQMDFSSKTIAK